MSEKGKPPSTTRIEAFSDGVIAIVATIMVLELHVPAQTFSSGEFWTVLGELGPDLSIFALSFVIVAIFLINHHALIRAAPYATPALFWWNANFLFWMALIPLSTSIYGKHPLTPLAASFYGLVFFANAASLLLLRRYVAKLNPGQTEAERETDRVLARKDMLFSGLCAIAVPLAFVSEVAAMIIFIIVPAGYFVPGFAFGRR